MPSDPHKPRFSQSLLPALHVPARRPRAWRGCAAVAGLVLAAAPARAAVVQVSYTGTVGFGFDTTGMFGPAGASYTNSSYTLVYTIDDAAPGATFSATPTMTEITGLGANSPVHAALTVNGVTRTINGSNTGTAQQYDLIYASGQPYNGVSDKIRQVSNEYAFLPGISYHDYSAETYVSSYALDFVSTPDFHAPLFYPGNSSTDSVCSLVQFNDFDYVTNTQVNYAYFNLTVLGAQVTSVPEPAGAVLLLLGLAGVLRRGRPRSC